ncbi:hypothetical protein BD626DRAFT_395349 [Schizophyllum amplum]|uniref:NAD(P)-binding domain-containing protein n=1 Tax=Schizophyllum amplum TaxID=97359 RepID=A0A550CSX8_9AGAR|nr:hypothetical protein BD626DRAFT_395349 [Auriculariopsis ampla]
MSDLSVLVLGGSKNIGYYAAVRLLAAGATVTFLLRNATVFDQDPVLQNAIMKGKARLVKGDALKKDDVAHAWAEAGKDAPVGVLLSTVGGAPKVSLTKGVVLDPPNIVTQCVFNILCTMPKDAPQPRMVFVSSSGLTKRSHASIPVLLKPMYSYLLAGPHRDKMGQERVLSYCAGLPWDEGEAEPAEEIMGVKWQEREGLPAADSLKKVPVVRPALLTDGECEADKGKAKSYRVSEAELGGYTVSRKDVGHFIAKALLSEWDQYEGKIVNVGY